MTRRSPAMVVVLALVLVTVVWFQVEFKDHETSAGADPSSLPTVVPTGSGPEPDAAPAPPPSSGESPTTASSIDPGAVDLAELLRALERRSQAWNVDVFLVEPGAPAIDRAGLAVTGLALRVVGTYADLLGYFEALGRAQPRIVVLTIVMGQAGGLEAVPRTGSDDPSNGTDGTGETVPGRRLSATVSAWAYPSRPDRAGTAASVPAPERETPVRLPPVAIVPTTAGALQPSGSVQP